MFKRWFLTLACVVLSHQVCFAHVFPDLGGVLNFDRPHEISDGIFVLTNPKSGSHVLLYAIKKVTKSPLRQRLPFWHFENNPTFFPDENILGYDVDFSKPTFYWGHEFSILEQLNHSNNRLLFILRDIKENLASQLILVHKLKSTESKENLDRLLRKEVLEEGLVFREYMARLQLFDDWDVDNRYLVLFTDLVGHPEIFVPRVLEMMQDDSEYEHFIEHYAEFQHELRERYLKKGNGTKSGTNPRYFKQFTTLETRKIIDEFLKREYPVLWDRYLESFEELD